MYRVRHHRLVEGGLVQDLTIRQAQDGDTAAVVALVSALAEERGSTTDLLGTTDAVNACLGKTDHEILVAETGNQIVAYVAAHWVPFPLLGGLEGYISDLVVHAKWRGHGIGNQLMEAVQERALKLNCRRLMLHNRMVDESFERGFYLKLGFRQRTDYATFVKLLSEA